MPFESENTSNIYANLLCAKTFCQGCSKQLYVILFHLNVGGETGDVKIYDIKLIEYSILVY